MYPQITIGSVTVEALTSSARNIRRARRLARKGYTYNSRRLVQLAESITAKVVENPQDARPAYKFTAPKTLAAFNQQLADAGVKAQLVKFDGAFELSLWGELFDKWNISSFNHRTGTEWRQTLEAVYADAR